LWNAESREVNTLKVCERPVDVRDLSPDGQVVGTGGGGKPMPGSHGRVLHWWDLRTGTNAPLSAACCNKLLFSPDGGTLATFQRGTVQLWDATTHSLRTNLVIDPQAASPTGFPFYFRPVS